jgi:uncharacterized membrane protein
MIDRRLIVQLCSVAGILMLSYLFSASYTGSNTTLCNISESLNCDVASKSKYANFFGIPAPLLSEIPVSVIGIAYFLAVILLTTRGSHMMPHIFVVSAAAIPFSLYLSYVQYFVLGSVCLFCELSKVMIGIIAFASLSESLRRKLLKFEV